ncbi:MAG TPA: cytochrome P450 [Pseudonocardia sp.]|jgi:cytochrome P450|nr:cytochrome P450 [Pseudonocardia sp.]
MTEAVRDTHPVDWPYALDDPTIADDYTSFATSLRESCPRGWSDGRWSPNRSGFWFFTTFADTTEAASDWQLFSNAGGTLPVEMAEGAPKLLPLDCDPPLHGKIRNLLNPFFTPSAARAAEPRIAQVCSEIIDAMVGPSGTGDVEFMSQFAVRLPGRVFFEIFLGEDPDETLWMLPLVGAILRDPATAAEHAPRLFGWVSEVLERRREAGHRSDVLGVIAHAGTGSDFQLTDADRVQIGFLMMVAGMETTASALGCVAHRLALEPSLLDKLRGMDDAGLERAVDEFLRFDSPVPANARTVTRDETFAGCPMLASERVVLNWAAANHDPEHYPDPDRLDLDRDAGDNLAFGHGRHRCLGAHLARRQLKVALGQLRELRRFEVAPGATVSYQLGSARKPKALPLVLGR